MNNFEYIKQNIAEINKRITLACEKSVRRAEEIKLLLVTKTVSPDKISYAIGCGYPLIGENKVQEVRDKYAALEKIPHETHFIGHLQTNKIKDLLRYNVSLIQSLDRIDLAQKLQSRLETDNRSMNVLVQVNTSLEESKFGIGPEKALGFVKEVSKLKNIKVKGLMTIGKLTDNEDEVRACFRLLKNLKNEIVAEGIEGVCMDELSMGMSGDLEIAVEEGATMIRVGSAIFGERQY